MQKRSFRRDIFLLITCFLISRMIIKRLGVSFGYNALYEYWQYLDVTSLKGNLLKSLWYQHSQPPVFNFILGTVLKVSEPYSFYVFEFLLLLISLVNAILILKILRRVVGNNSLPLIFSLLYILSPATMLFENELFYTTFVSLLLLLAVYFMLRFIHYPCWTNTSGMFAALSLVCLTRSMYHLIWLIFISIVLVIRYYGKNGFGKLLITGLFSISLVGGWYLKNYLLFGNFSTSSWVGINFSRLVFHDNELTDSSNIASIHPFMPISYYRNFINDDYKKKYAGLNDRILLRETKDKGYINMNNAGYIEVSKKYMAASVDEVSKHPLSYLKHACTSLIIFFTPASSYFQVAANNNLIRYYDMVFSLNPAHLFKGDDVKKESLAIAAIPRFVVYFLTAFVLIRNAIRSKFMSSPNIFIITTILFSIIVSSLLDYGENMRFRYEIEPLFLILAAQVIMLFNKRRGYGMKEPAI